MGWSSWACLLAATILLGLGQPAYLAYLVWVISTNFGLLSLCHPVGNFPLWQTGTIGKAHAPSISGRLRSSSEQLFMRTTLLENLTRSASSRRLILSIYEPTAT